MALLEDICAEIAEYSESAVLESERNFSCRKKAMESISIVKRALPHGATYEMAEGLEKRILSINASLRQKYRQQILENGATREAIRAVFNRFTDYKEGIFGNTHYLEDDLDVFIDTIFGLDIEAIRIPNCREGMVHLERTPARVVLEMMDGLNLTGEETIVDLGSGLGHVVLVFGLLKNAKCIGIEIETLYCEASMRAMETLNIPNVSIVNEDVQDVDLGEGDIFFMYSPFFGHVMNCVLTKLRHIAEKKRIRICSYGNSTLVLGGEPWLRINHRKTPNPHCAATFTSIAAE
jgi:hypothetical protein